MGQSEPALQKGYENPGRRVKPQAIRMDLWQNGKLIHRTARGADANAPNQRKQKPAHDRAGFFIQKKKAEAFFFLAVIAVSAKGISLVLAGLSAVRAADRLVLKAFFLKELLLTLGEHELRATILANKRLVFHNSILPCECSFLDVPVLKDSSKSSVLVMGGQNRRSGISLLPHSITRIIP